VPVAADFPITLEQAKEHVGIRNTEHDNELPPFLGAAAKMIAHRCGPLTAIDVVEDHRAPGDLLLLREWPVLSVTAVTLFPAGTTVAAADFETGASGYVLDPDMPALTYSFGLRNVRVAYTAGRSELPDDLRDAVLDLFAHLWRASQNRVGLGQRAVFGGSNPDQDAPFPAGFAMPRRVAELIEGELRPVVLG
jgi:hypothetical protein